MADKILMEVTLDRETYNRLKDETGVSVKNGADLIRAVYILLNQREGRDK